MIGRLRAAIKFTSMRSLLTIVLVGVLVVVTTACNGNPPASQVSALGENQSSKELYDPVQNKKSGGMYPYEDMDTDPSARTQRKARELVDNAKKNVGKVNSPQEFVQSFNEGTPLDERVKNISKDVAESAKELTEDVSSGTKRNVRKLKENTQNAIENPESIVNN